MSMYKDSGNPPTTARRDRPTPPLDSNPDPITGEPGAHPVGTGLGAAGGAIAGAAIGTIGGPVGMAAGAVIGAVILLAIYRYFAGRRAPAAGPGSWPR